MAVNLNNWHKNYIFSALKLWSQTSSLNVSVLFSVSFEGITLCSSLAQLVQILNEGLD